MCEGNKNVELEGDTLKRERKAVRERKGGDGVKERRGDEGRKLEVKLLGHV